MSPSINKKPIEIVLILRLHYEITIEPPTTAPTPLSMSCQYSQFGSSPNGPTSPSDNGMKVGPGSGSSSVGGTGGVGYFGSTPPHGMPGLPQPPRQKGRPRKRKPKDIESMTSNLGESSLRFFIIEIYFAFALLKWIWSTKYIWLLLSN